MKEVTVEYHVSVGSGPYLPRVFHNEIEARAYYNAEIELPSYFGPGHKRQGSFVKVTTIVEDMT